MLDLNEVVVAANLKLDMSNTTTSIFPSSDDETSSNSDDDEWGFDGGSSDDSYGPRDDLQGYLLHLDAYAEWW